MIDTHAHIQDEMYTVSVEEIINNAKQNGVNKIICSSSSLKTALKAVEISNKFDEVYATVGVHPEEANEYSESVEQQLEELAKNRKVVAIGEIGLDYCYEFATREKQKEVFIKQIELANKLKMPVVIHTRDASGDTMEILRSNLDKLKNGVCIHCYSMSVEILKEILEYGFYISVGGVVTFKNANKLIDVVEICPIDKLMLETDSPYLSPVPFRGKINEPKNVVYVNEKIAEIKNMRAEEVEKITTENAYRFFRI